MSNVCKAGIVQRCPSAARGPPGSGKFCGYHDLMSWIPQDNPNFKPSGPLTPESHQNLQDLPVALLRGHPVALAPACQALWGWRELGFWGTNVVLVTTETGGRLAAAFPDFSLPCLPRLHSSILLSWSGAVLKVRSTHIHLCLDASLWLVPSDLSVQDPVGSSLEDEEGADFLRQLILLLSGTERPLPFCGLYPSIWAREIAPLPWAEVRSVEEAGGRGRHWAGRTCARGR